MKAFFSLLALGILTVPYQASSQTDLKQVVAVQQAEISHLKRVKLRLTDTLPFSTRVAKGPDGDTSAATHLFTHEFSRSGDFKIDYSLSVVSSTVVPGKSRNFKIMIAKNNVVQLYTNQNLDTSVAGTWSHITGHALLTDIKAGDVVAIAAIDPSDSGSTVSFTVAGNKHSSWSIIEL